MTGFWRIALMYAGLWTVLLLPGVWFLVRRVRTVALPDDDPRDDAWVTKLRRDLSARAPEQAVAASHVRTDGSLKRRRPTSELPVVRVAGRLTVPESSIVDASLIVEGDLRVEGGGRVLGNVWVKGNLSLGPKAVISSAIVDRAVYLDGAIVDGGLAAAGVIDAGSGSRVNGPAMSRVEITLAPGAIVGSALAPIVRGTPDPNEPVLVELSDAEPIPAVDWTPKLDAALSDVWPEGRLAQIVEAIADRTGVMLRGVQILVRARELGLFSRGLPRRPAVLGRRPAWVLEPETIRVGADLRVPPGVIVNYSLIVEGSLEVFQDAQLEAPARAGRGVLIHAGAVVYGQLAADALIVCEEGTAVLGPMDCSTHILLFSNARVGLPDFGGVHALGAIGLEPGAVIYGGAVAGFGVRGEPLRTEEQRRITVESLPDVDAARAEVITKKKRGRRRKKKAKSKKGKSKASKRSATAPTP